MIEISEILYRWNKSVSKQQIGRSLGVARNTVKEVIKQAEGLGFIQGRSSADEIASVSQKLIEARKAKPKNPNGVQIILSKWHDQIKSWHEEPNMTVMQIMRLLAENGEMASETSL